MPANAVLSVAISVALKVDTSLRIRAVRTVAVSVPELNPKPYVGPLEGDGALAVAAPVVADRPELVVLGSSSYGPRFAAVNGMSAVFAHHMSPELAFEALLDYRRRFDPGPSGATPYSAMSVLAFASEDTEAVRDDPNAHVTLIGDSRAC